MLEQTQQIKILSKINNISLNQNKKQTISTTVPKTVPKMASHTNKSNTHLQRISGYSPIKTRLNVRQTLLHSLNQQEDENKKLDEPQDDSNGKNTRRIKLNQQYETNLKVGEPSVKKLKQTQSLETSLNKTKKSDQNNESLLNKTQILSSNIASQTSPVNMNSNNSLLTNKQDSRINSHINLNTSNQYLMNKNPIYWMTEDVCNYLIESKFDPNLIYLIKEHVSCLISY